MIAPFEPKYIVEVAYHSSPGRTHSLLPNDSITHVDLRPSRRLDEYKSLTLTIAYSPGID